MKVIPTMGVVLVRGRVLIAHVGICEVFLVIGDPERVSSPGSLPAWAIYPWDEVSVVDILPRALLSLCRPLVDSAELMGNPD